MKLIMLSGTVDKIIDKVYSNVTVIELLSTLKKDEDYFLPNVILD